MRKIAITRRESETPIEAAKRIAAECGWKLRGNMRIYDQGGTERGIGAIDSDGKWASITIFEPAARTEEDELRDRQCAEWVANKYGGSVSDLESGYIG